MTWMKLKVAAGVAAAILLTSGTASLVLSQNHPEQTNEPLEITKNRALLVKLLTATEKKDYQAFLADGDRQFKSLERTEFDAVAVQLSGRLKKGYDLSYLGELQQGGYTRTVWKLKFNDQGDDRLAQLYVKDGKIGAALVD